MESTEDRIEYSEHLWITTGIPGDDQESSFMNATLQSTDDPTKFGGGLEFSVAVHVAVPSGALTEEKLRDYLASVFGEAIHHTNQVFGPGILNVEIQIGPAGGGEEDD